MNNRSRGFRKVSDTQWVSEETYQANAFFYWSMELSGKYWYLSLPVAIACFYFVMSAFWGSIGGFVVGLMFAVVAAFFGWAFAISFILPYVGILFLLGLLSKI